MRVLITGGAGFIGQRTGELLLKQGHQVTILDNLSLVTDYDAGLEGAPEVAAVQAHDVMRVLAGNIARVRDLLADLIPMIPTIPSCDCQRSLEGARM